jgi:hypothetical protein
MRLLHHRPEKKNKLAFRRLGPAAIAITLLASSPMGSAKDATVLTIKSPDDVRTYLSRPVDTDTQGNIKGMRIVVPLPKGEKDTYLVMELKGEELDELKHGDLKSRIVELQKGMLKQHLKVEKEPIYLRRTPPKEKKSASLGRLGPMPPRLVGGKGTDGSPFLLEIPVPVKDTALVVKRLYSSEGNSSTIKTSGVAASFALVFVGAEASESRPTVTSIGQISPLITSALGKHIERYFKAELTVEKMRSMNIYNLLKASVKSALRNAQGRHPAIRAYLSD